MLFADAPPWADEPAQPATASRAGVMPSPEVAAPAAVPRSESASASGRSARLPGSVDGAGVLAGPVPRRAGPAPVNVEPMPTSRDRAPVETVAPAAASLRPRDVAPGRPAERAAVTSPRTVQGSPGPARQAAEPPQAPVAAVSALTVRVAREPVGTPIAPVLSDPTDPVATVTPTETPAPPMDREPEAHVAAAHPASVSEPLPPVTIGEIHVHVAAPAEAPPDPLALLAPWANGLTSRRTAMP
jgi:hypothetical protein